MKYRDAPAGDGQVSPLTFRLSSSIPNSNTQTDCLEAQLGRRPHSHYVSYFTHGNQRSYMPANLAPHCLMCMYTHIHNTHSQSSWQPLAHVKVGLLSRTSGSPLLTTPARSCSSILPLWSALIRCVSSLMGLRKVLQSVWADERK